MEFVNLIALFGIMIVMAAIPSASVVVVVSRSVAYGLRHGAAAAVGVAAGDLVFVVLALGGLSATAEALGEHFVIAKYLGGLYLIWFGLSLLRSKGSARQARVGTHSLVRSYLAGFLLTLGDLKAVFFYASLFPAFVDVAQLSLPEASAIAFAAGLIVGLVKFGYAYAGYKVGLSSGTNWRSRAATSIAGGVSVGAGAFILANAAWPMAIGGE